MDIKARFLMMPQIESTQEAIQASYSLKEDASVVATGWAGRDSSKLPLKSPVLYKLVKEDDMVYFPWDGC
jgi:hypothetical protein